MLLSFFFKTPSTEAPALLRAPPFHLNIFSSAVFFFCGLSAFAVLVLCRRSTVQPRDPARGERALPQTASPQHRQIQNGLLWCKSASCHCTIKCTVFIVFAHTPPPPIQLRLYWVNIYGWNHILSLCFVTYMLKKLSLSQNLTFKIGIN